MGNPKARLLSREDFKIQVFRRDLEKCVHCKNPAVDAHHILDRSLWVDGGYYLENGVSLCSQDHLAAEKTLLDCETLRKEANISAILLPPQLEIDETYDKWGNILKKDGARYPGELFWNENVQKTLREAGLLDSFIPRIKYPRTYHLPWSLGKTNDDSVLDSDSIFNEAEVVVTEKLDGENTTMTRDYIHARSLDSRSHPSRDWVKSLWGNIRWEIPQGWRLCGENMYAVHSLRYENLSSYFYLFSVWDQSNTCLSWDQTKEWAELLGLEIAPVLFEGKYNKEKIEKLWTKQELESKEGYVVRTKESFGYRDFKFHVAKFVRPQHVQTDEHWMSGAIVKNKLRNSVHVREDI